MMHDVIDFLVDFSKGDVEMKSQVDNHTLNTAVSSFYMLQANVLQQ